MREMETIAASSRCHVRTQRFRCLIKALSRDPRLVQLDWTKKDGEPELQNQFIIRNAPRVRVKRSGASREMFSSRFYLRSVSRERKILRVDQSESIIDFPIVSFPEKLPVFIHKRVIDLPGI